MPPEPKSPSVAAWLNLLPGVGNFYLGLSQLDSVGEAGGGAADVPAMIYVGLGNFFTWPASMLWGPVEAARDARIVNTREAIRYYLDTAEGFAIFSGATGLSREDLPPLICYGVYVRSLLGYGHGPFVKRHAGAKSRWGTERESPVADSSVALVIGISDYAFMGKIKGCRHDAEAIAEALKRACGIPRDNIIVMTDRTRGSCLPTKATIEERIKICAREARHDGMVFIFFSGHGVCEDGKLLLVAKDCMPTSGIPISQILENLCDSPARAKVLMLDVCHAGAAQKGVRVMPKGVELSELLKEDNVEARTGKDVALFLSCAKDEYSYPLRDGSGSVYTDAVVRALERARGEKAPLTAVRLQENISNMMRQWRLREGKSQTPQLMVESGSDVVLVPGGTVE